MRKCSNKVCVPDGLRKRVRVWKVGKSSPINIIKITTKNKFEFSKKPTISARNNAIGEIGLIESARAKCVKKQVSEQTEQLLRNSEFREARKFSISAIDEHRGSQPITSGLAANRVRRFTAAGSTEGDRQYKIVNSRSSIRN